MHVCLYVVGELTGNDESMTKTGEQQIQKQKNKKKELKTHEIAKLKQVYLCIFLEVGKKDHKSMRCYVKHY